MADNKTKRLRKKYAAQNCGGTGQGCFGKGGKPWKRDNRHQQKYRNDISGTEIVSVAFHSG